MFYFCIPWKHQKSGGFIIFSGGYESLKIWSRKKWFLIEKWNHDANMTIAFSQKMHSPLRWKISKVERYGLKGALHTQKRSFPVKISSVYLTKSADNYGFGPIYWKNP